MPPRYPDASGGRRGENSAVASGSRCGVGIPASGSRCDVRIPAPGSARTARIGAGDVTTSSGRVRFGASATAAHPSTCRTRPPSRPPPRPGGSCRRWRSTAVGGESGLHEISSKPFGPPHPPESRPISATRTDPAPRSKGWRWGCQACVMRESRIPVPASQRPHPSARIPVPASQCPHPSAQIQAPKSQRPNPSAQIPAPKSQRPVRCGIPGSHSVGLPALRLTS